MAPLYLTLSKNQEHCIVLYISGMVIHHKSKNQAWRTCFFTKISTHTIYHRWPVSAKVIVQFTYLPYISELWYPQSLRYVLPIMLTFVFFNLLNLVGDSKHIWNQFFFSTAICPYVSLRITRDGCRGTSNVVGSHNNTFAHGGGV